MKSPESTFHQVLVPQHQSGAVSDFEMMVRVFGATLSPICCNYALKRTAVNSKGKKRTNKKNIR